MKMLFKKGDNVKITDEFRKYFLSHLPNVDRADDIKWLFCNHQITKCEKASFNDCQIIIKTDYISKYHRSGTEFYLNYNFEDDASKLKLFKKI